MACIITPMNSQKSIRMNFRFSPETRQALEKLAANQEVTMSDVLSNLVKRSAQRRKLWANDR